VALAVGQNGICAALRVSRPVTHPTENPPLGDACVRTSAGSFYTRQAT
jgi:hypothetical protein